MVPVLTGHLPLLKSYIQLTCSSSGYWRQSNDQDCEQSLVANVDGILYMRRPPCQHSRVGAATPSSRAKHEYLLIRVEIVHAPSKWQYVQVVQEPGRC